MPSIPGFGQADLSNCEREQIHLAASIQPHGVLLLVSEPEHVVVQASANAAAFLRLEPPADVLGLSLEQLPGDLLSVIRPHLAEPLHDLPTAVRCSIGDPPARFDCLLHRPPGGGYVIELEPAGPSLDLGEQLENALHGLASADSLTALCNETAAVCRRLTGYDRVMVYRFDENGHGEVFAERREAELEPFLGNRYPASDIPQIARRLYLNNRVRLLVDVDYQPTPLRPHRSPLSGQELDMSLCFLRSMSPIHVQYLKNMGVSATLVISLVVGGKLWGLIACHHYQPRFIHYQLRAMCELLAEVVATRIAALESFLQAQAELSVRRLEQRMIEAISRDGDWRAALFDKPQTLLQPLAATGAALLFEGRILSTGEVPGTAEMRELGSWLDSLPRREVIATDSLAEAERGFGALKEVVSGLLAAPISNVLGEYLLWFRPERVRTVTWGGNPFKPVEIGNDPRELSPRRSFSQWHQLVEESSEPWTPAELTTARLIGESVADVIHQFRSVRLLIAQNQLSEVSEQVQHARQAVVISDPEGRVLLVNRSFQTLFANPPPPLQHVEGMAALFSDADDVRQHLQQLLRLRRPWRGEIELRLSGGEGRPLLVRADPVFSAPDKVLGHVLLFTDAAERKTVKVARRRFQQDIVERRLAMSVPPESAADLVFRNLLAAVVDNAQLAALEITDGTDLGGMPGLLDSVQTSVARAATLLEHLISHAAEADEDRKRQHGAPPSKSLRGR